MTQESDAGRLALAGALTMAETERICSDLRAAVAAGGRVAVDCAGAAEIDLSFVQLLLAARASAGGAVTLAGRPRGALLDVLERAGFAAGEDPANAGFWFA